MNNNNRLSKTARISAILALIIALIGVIVLSFTFVRSSSAAEGSTWNYSVSYINEDDPYDVFKTSDFNLKYEVDFHTSEDIPAYDPETGLGVVIRIPATLLVDRNGIQIRPNQLGIPSSDPRVENWVPKKTKNSSFNYYVDETTGELVFFNYEAITAGSNDAWQITYKNIKAMDIIDMSTWTLTPTASVSVPSEIEGENRTESYSVTPLTGTVDTTAVLTSLSKTAFSGTGKSYGPGLYTEKQVSRYITGGLPTDFSGDNFSKYKYVLYQVTVGGRGSQPFNLGFKEKTTVEGAVSGRVVGAIAAKPAGTATQGLEGYQLYWENSKRSSWSEQFFVVVAYPAEQVNVGTIVENEIDVKLVPYDKVDAPSEKVASAKWSYADYNWRYPGDIYGLDKSFNETYPGWLKVYEAVSKRASQYPEEENVYADFPFTTRMTARAFSVAHVVSTGQGGNILGSIKDPTASYRTSMFDDAFYGIPAGDPTDSKGVMLDGNDYYFTSVSVSQTDKGYDVWEDMEIAPENMADTSRQGIKIYAMLANPAPGDVADPKGWIQVGSVAWNGSGSMRYSFDAATIAKRPYRVRVDHETINYLTSCDITVNVHVNVSSPKVQQWIAKNPDIANIQFEDVSGATVEILHNGASSATPTWVHDYTIHDSNYSEPGLIDFSNNLYGTLPVRDNAFKNVTLVNETAESRKSSTTENDVINGRLNVKYTITAQDGYCLYSLDAAKYLSNLGLSDGLASPGRNEVVFYDLLPYAMEYDPYVAPVAGRMTSSNQTNSNSWSKSQVSVRVDESDIITNWRNTGRTLVKFHIVYSGADPTFFSAKGGDSLWAEGWGVTFSGYWDWKDLDISDNTSNIAAFQPEKNDNERLLGLDTEVFKDDGKGTDPKGGNKFSDIAGLFGADIDEDGNTAERNVMYSSCKTSDDVPLAAKSSIQKYVKADSDVFGSFRQTTAVEPSGTYTYDITTTNPSYSSMSDLVIYDHIENAVNDRQKYGVDLYGDLTFDEQYWQGSLLSIDTTAAELEGIAPVVWANADPMAPTSELDKSQAPSEVLTAANGWYKLSDFLSRNGNDITKVKSVAIDLSLKADGQKFTLGALKSISVRLHLKAPASVPAGTVWAYNNPLFYATNDVTHVHETVAGDSVRVALGSPKDIEIEKEFTWETPQPVHDVFDNEPFRIRIVECPLYDPTYGTACPFDNVDAWKAEHSGAEVPEHEHIAFSDRIFELYNKTAEGTWVRDDSRIYATDANGYAEVKAGQKIVFKKIPEPGRLLIEEEENPFWDDSYVAGSYTTESGDEVVTTLVENRYKPVLYAQKTLDAVPTTEAGVLASQQSFTFQVFVNGEPASTTEYWYVKQAYLNGAIPVKDTTKGNAGIGYTDEQGKFAIRQGDIIALRPGRQGDKWEIREINSVDSDWVCKEPSVSGNLEVLGSSGTIQNIYRWKDLLLTKEITHQTTEEAKGQEFTFKVELETSDGENYSYEPVSGNRWVVMDGNNEMTAERWTELGRTGSFQGNLSADGTFTSAVAGLVVKIEHLDAEHTYRISEPEDGYGAPYYLPVSGNVAVKMPLYSLSKSATYTNDWRKRPLTVKKIVEYDRNGSYASTIESQLKTKKFEMTVEILDTTAGQSEYSALANFPYTLMTQEGTTTTGITDENGRFTIRSNEYAVFKDAGFIGSEFRVTETQESGAEAFRQVYPADEAPAVGKLEQDDNIANIVNGAPGIFTLTKSYSIVSGDMQAEKFYQDVCSALDKKDANQALSAYEELILERAQVTFLMKTKNAEGKWTAWPDADYEMTLMTYKGEKKTFTWKAGESLTLYPGQSVITKAGQLSPSAEYMVTESAASKKWIWRVTDDKWLRCEQTEPTGGKSLSGVVAVSPSAKIVNSLTTFDVVGSLAEKHMMLGSEEVPEGATLTWIVERYDTDKGIWRPADGIPYITFSGDGTHNWTTEEVLYTLEDGRITLEASSAGLPWVKFVEDKVYLGNKQEPNNGDLRIRELVSESDPEWGQLAGYVKDEADDIFYADDDKDGITLDPTDTIAFVNSNRTTSLEIEKQTTENTDKTFTMVLEQIIETSDGKQPADDMSNVVTKTAGANLPYTLYDSASGQVVGTGRTNDAGEIVLHGGQYAHFDIPDKTFWVVHEKDTVGWQLQTMTPNNDDDPIDESIEKGRLHKVGDNAMLARQSAQTLDVKLRAEEKTPAAHKIGETLNRDQFNVWVVDSDGNERTLEATDAWRLVPSKIPTDAFADGPAVGTWHVDVWYGSLWTSIPIQVTNSIIAPRTWAFEKTPLDS